MTDREKLVELLSGVQAGGVALDHEALKANAVQNDEVGIAIGAAKRQIHGVVLQGSGTKAQAFVMCIQGRKPPMKTPEEIKKGLECLDKMQFFMGQRAGRELWADKPHEIQEKDIESFNRDIETVRNLIRQLEAQVPKWISVEDRLPEATIPPHDVLVYHNIGGGMYIDRAWYSYDIHKWRSCLGDKLKVTHWMPLPEPPKEEA